MIDETVHRPIGQTQSAVKAYMREKEREKQREMRERGY